MKPSDSFRMHRAVIRRLVESNHARVFGSGAMNNDLPGLETTIRTMIDGASDS